MNRPSVQPTMLFPWRHPVRLWRSLLLNVTALPMAIVGFVVIAVLLSVAFGTAFTVFLAVPAVWLLMTMSHAVASVERGRIEALSNTEIDDPVPPLQQTKFFRRLFERLRSKPRWKEIAYHAAHLLVGTLAFAIPVAAWAGAFALAATPVYVDWLPGDSAKYYFFEIERGVGAALATVVGVAGLLFIAPWISLAFRRAQVDLATSLIGPSADARHAAEVQRVEQRRSAAVDSAESERRRIERDLHDGAQQRLVALATSLGVARQQLESNPDEGRRTVAAAHDEAKAALKEIRDLVRGIHPVILEDRGLDAALSAVVARSPVPVTLDVNVAGRLPGAVESTAYFVVSEALTNVAKHSQATRVHVSVVRANDRLVLEIRDDGVGGAVTGSGSGLTGLRDRVTGLGGSLYVLSPPGGPTTVTAELPCGS